MPLNTDFARNSGNELISSRISTKDLDDLKLDELENVLIPSIVGATLISSEVADLESSEAISTAKFEAELEYLNVVKIKSRRWYRELTLGG